MPTGEREREVTVPNSPVTDGGTATAREGVATKLSEQQSGTGQQRNVPDVSVLVPVTERPENLAELYRTYAAPLRGSDWTYEFVFALEPAYRDLAEQLTPLVEADEPVRVLEAGQAVGEASLVKRAADLSTGKFLLTLPAYHRVLPASLVRLLDTVDEGADLAVARRRPRKDPWINRVQTRVFHFLLRGISKRRFDDLACGVRAMRRQVLEETPLYGDFFRFFPLLAENQGYRVEQVDGGHHPEDRRTRVYSPGVYVRRLLDLLGVFFLVRFTYKPLRFFGLVGGGVSFVGAVILGILFVQRIGGQGIADRPMLLLGVLLFTLGVQAVALGLIGEIIVHLNAPERPGYRVLEVVEERGEE